MAQSLMTLLFTGLLLLAQTLGINTGTERKSVNDLVAAFNDLRATFLEPEGDGTLEQAETADQTARQTAAGLQHLTLGQGEVWETTYYVVDSGIEGPTVMVVAGLHGDEPAALLAGQELIEEVQAITRGKVILVPEANAEAIEARKRAVDADLNRVFPIEAVRGESPSPKAPAAAAVWSLVEEHRPDWLIDLHDESSDVTGQTVIFHEAHEESAWAAEALANQLNATLAESDTPFRTASGPPSGSLARAASELFDVRTLTLETHRRHSLSARAGWLSGGVTYLLTYLGML